MLHADKVELRKLLLITDGFPYGHGESFLYPEVEILRKAFSITVVTTTTESKLSDSFIWEIQTHRVNCQLNLFDLLKGIFVLIRSNIFRKEAFIILKMKQHIFKRIAQAVNVYLKAVKFSNELESLHIVQDQQLIYTYWHNYKLLGTGLVLDRLERRDIPIVSRIHGYDLYNERARGNRQPFKSAMDSYLSGLFFVSQKGYDYYKETFGFQPHCEYKVARLGVFDPSHITPVSTEFDLSLISVANAIPLKRIHLIIEALALIEAYSVRWVYFGGGSSLEKLQQLAECKLSEKTNIDYAFKEAVPNREVYDFYLNNEIDAFITTSSTEGLPVSIMEAFANGVPAIGTAVGGIPEMLHNTENGYLIAENPSVEDIVIALKSMMKVKKTNTFREMKETAYKTWSEMFDAENNFNEFASYLNSL